MGSDHKVRLLALEMCKRVGPRGEFEQDDAVAVLADDFQQFAHGPKRTAAARDFPLEGQTGSGVIVGSGSGLEFWLLAKPSRLRLLRTIRVRPATCYSKLKRSTMTSGGAR